MSDEGNGRETAGRRPGLFLIALALSAAVCCLVISSSVLLDCAYCDERLPWLALLVGGPVVLAPVGRIAWIAAKPARRGQARGKAGRSIAVAGLRPRALRAAGWLSFYLLGVGEEPTPRERSPGEGDPSIAQAGLKKALCFGGVLCLYFACVGAIFSWLAPGFCDEEPCPDLRAPLVVALVAFVAAGLSAWNAVARPLRAVAYQVACGVLALVWLGLVSEQL